MWQRWGKKTKKQKTNKQENVNSGDFETLAPFLLTVRRYHRLKETEERQKTEEGEDRLNRLFQVKTLSISSHISVHPPES